MKTTYNDSLCPLDASFRPGLGRGAVEQPGAVAGARGEQVGVVGGAPVVFVDVEPLLTRKLLLGGRGEALQGADVVRLLAVLSLLESLEEHEHIIRGRQRGGG